MFQETLAASVGRRNTKHKKDENTRIERKEIWQKKVREIGWVALIHAFFFNKKPVYKKPRTRYPQTTPNLRNFKNYKKNGILT